MGAVRRLVVVTVVVSAVVGGGGARRDAVAGPSPLPVGRPVSVLVVGDSIARGSLGYASFRGPLVQLLERAGHEIEMAGPFVDGPAPTWRWWDRQHAGANGQTAAGLALLIREWLLVARPDVVLVTVGSNDARLATPVEAVRFSMSAVIEAARTSGAWVLLSEVTPRWRRPLDPDPGYVAHLNLALQELVAPYDPCQVRWVPQPGFFEHDTVDGVHPNAGGEVKLAAGFAAAMTTPC